MAEEKKKDATQQEEEEKKKAQDLPFCTTAASPEHHRGSDLEEPCDDAREGEYEKGE